MKKKRNVEADTMTKHRFASFFVAPMAVTSRGFGQRFRVAQDYLRRAGRYLPLSYDLDDQNSFLVSEGNQRDCQLIRFAEIAGYRVLLGLRRFQSRLVRCDYALDRRL